MRDLREDFEEATKQVLMFCHETESCCNSNTHCPISLKLDMFDKSHVLETSTWQYSVIVTTQPTGHRKWQFLQFAMLILLADPPQKQSLSPWWCYMVKLMSSHWMHNSTWSRKLFFTFHKGPGLKTSKYQVIKSSSLVIAPPTGNRKQAFCDNHLIYVKLSWCGLHLIYLNHMHNKWVFSGATYWSQEVTVNSAASKTH